MKPKKPKKRSIREFIQEDGLKFELYLLKYSNALKYIKEKTKDEIIFKSEKDKKKRIRRFINDSSKPQFSNEIAQLAIKKNIIYVQSTEPLIEVEEIHRKFEYRRSLYIETLKNRIKENQTATLENDRSLLRYAESVVLTSDVKKERFGQMLLLMIKNLATMPSFSGYSDNWKTDFFSNAIEKTLLYLDNFDEDLLSKRTGNKSNAFAYITQICFNAFINIINIRKKEARFLKDAISFESSNLEGVKYYDTSHISDASNALGSSGYIGSTKYKVQVTDINDFESILHKSITHISLSNKIFNNNKTFISEIEHLEKTTPEQDKNEDYEDYIMELNKEVLPYLEPNIIDTLVIMKPDEMSLLDFKMPEKEKLRGIELVITNKRKYTYINRNQKEDNKGKIRYIIKSLRGEIDEFDKEW